MYPPKRSFCGAWCDFPLVKPYVRIPRIRLSIGGRLCEMLYERTFAYAATLPAGDKRRRGFAPKRIQIIYILASSYEHTTPMDMNMPIITFHVSESQLRMDVKS